MSTESVKVCLLPSALTYYERPLTGQSAAVYTITSNPLSFASELVGLISRKDISASKHTNKKVKDSLARILPSHITAAFQKWALVTKKKWRPPSTMTPNSLITGVSTQRTKCLGQTPMPSPPDFLGSPSAIPFTMKTPCS